MIKKLILLSLITCFNPSFTVPEKEIMNDEELVQKIMRKSMMDWTACGILTGVACGACCTTNPNCLTMTALCGTAGCIVGIYKGLRRSTKEGLIKDEIDIALEQRRKR